MSQLSLLGREPAGFDASFASLRHVELGEGAWLDHVPGWLRGHADVFDALHASTRWRTSEEKLYGRTIATPRLIATLPDDGPGHAVLSPMRRVLEERYRETFPRVSLALYRDGRDSVAWHGDRVARTLPEALVATLSLGAPRRFLLRPKGGGHALVFELGAGDLLVMGGACQRTFQHSIPKVAHANPRIAVMFRPNWAER